MQNKNDFKKAVNHISWTLKYSHKIVKLEELIIYLWSQASIELKLLRRVCQMQRSCLFDQLCFRGSRFTEGCYGVQSLLVLSVAGHLDQPGVSIWPQCCWHLRQRCGRILKAEQASKKEECSWQLHNLRQSEIIL